MALLGVSLDRRGMTPALFERASFAADELPSALARVAQDVAEVAILSTCARVEIYARSERFHDGVAALRRFLTSRSLTAAELDGHLTCFGERRAAEHLFLVAAGLDSIVLGEPQVLSQVRRCGAVARRLGATGTVLDELFKRAVAAGRRARAETRIGDHGSSLAHAAVGWLAQNGDVAAATVLVVGAGEMGAIAATELAARGAKVLVCNRTRERADALAARLGLGTIALEDLSCALPWADCIVASGAANRPVITSQDLRRALAERAGRPIRIVDIGVPHNVETEGLDKIEIVNIDGLNGIIPADLGADLDRAREIVTSEAARFVLWRRMNAPEATDAIGLEGA